MGLGQPAPRGPLPGGLNGGFVAVEASGARQEDRSSPRFVANGPTWANERAVSPDGSSAASWTSCSTSLTASAVMSSRASIVSRKPVLDRQGVEVLPLSFGGHDHSFPTDGPDGSHSKV